MGRRNRETTVWGRLGGLIGAIMLAGCSRPSAFQLEQPQADAAERRLELRSEQVYWTQHDGVMRVLAEIPLPGARRGRPTYVLYLRAAPGKPGKDGAPAWHEVRGFLIQTRGGRRGLTPVTAGTVRAAGRPESSPAGWKARVELAFEDGSRLSGDLLARQDDWRLKRFETREHPADVQALVHAPATDRPGP